MLHSPKNTVNTVASNSFWEGMPETSTASEAWNGHEEHEQLDRAENENLGVHNNKKAYIIKSFKKPRHSDC